MGNNLRNVAGPLSYVKTSTCKESSHVVNELPGLILRLQRLETVVNIKGLQHRLDHIFIAFTVFLHMTLQRTTRAACSPEW